MARAADPVIARAAATRVVSRLRDAGHIAYFAGGCVRDELLNLAPTDYDVATDATPDRVASLFDRTHLVGVAFGVVLVKLCPPGHASAATIEVATFRSDGPYSDTRRPDVIHFSDPRADARRRDFTINALFLDPLAAPDPSLPRVRGRIIDYVGGLADLQAGIVRAVGDPDLRLAEDHLRALRAVRFSARLRFTLDPATAGAIRRHAAELRGVSRERVGEEVRRMLLHRTRAAAATLLQELVLDAPVLDSPHKIVDLPTLRGIDDADPDRPVPYATALTAWALDRDDTSLEATPSPARSRRARSRVPGLVRVWRNALRLSNEERDELAATLSAVSALRNEWTTLSEATQKRLAGQAAFEEALRLLKVREPVLAAALDRKIEELRDTPSGIAPEPYVTGDDLVRLGAHPGPLFKRVLDAVYDAQLEGRVRSKSEAMELARSLCV